jgi:hypothetical protein
MKLTRGRQHKFSVRGNRANGIRLNETSSVHSSRSAVLPICLSHAEHDRGQDVLPVAVHAVPEHPRKRTDRGARQAAEDGCLSTFVNGCNDCSNDCAW